MAEKIMSPEEFKKRMGEINKKLEPLDHIEADNLMCELLKQLGYGEGIEIYEEMDRWHE